MGTMELSTKSLDLGIPSFAKDQAVIADVENQLRQLSTWHKLYLHDSRDMSMVEDECVHLIVTSPPYWTLKNYRDLPGQLGNVRDYKKFLHELDKVWKECYRLLVPGGRLVVVVGDVCLSRRKHGRHRVVPLHADIQVRCSDIGFDNLAPIIWYKIANIKFEVENGSSFLGKPYEPNAIIKNDIEFILMQRKPGGYRKPTPEMRYLSIIPEKYHKEWFNQIWQIHGDSTRHHPAPFPAELSERIVRMFSFAGDTVLDPFAGTGTTNVAAIRWGRNSIGFEIDKEFFEFARKRIEKETMSLYGNRIFQAIKE